MTFDPTITIGAILIALTQISSMFWFAIRMDKRIDILSMNVENLGKRVDAQGDTIKEHSKIGERFATLEGRTNSNAQMMTIVQRDVSDLRRGNGFITTVRERVDGEY